MKLAVLLIIIASNVYSSDFRLVGPNLYDFSKAGRGIYYFGWSNMRISHVYDRSIQIEITHEHEEFIPEYDRPIPGDSASLLHTLGQMQTVRSMPHMSPGVAFVLGLNGHSEQIINTTTVYVLHAPSQTSLDFEAVPVGRSVWDCGIPFEGDTTVFKSIYRVLPDRIIRESQISPQEKKDAAERAICFELEQASNNIASFQFEVGKRYLSGSGRPKNTNTGYYWITLSASNGYRSAIKFLTTTNLGTPTNSAGTR